MNQTPQAHRGVLVAGDEYVDAANNAYVAVNAADESSHTAQVTLGSRKINAELSNDGADTWSTRNTLSGGSAPLSDKGFAGTISLPTTTPPAACGGDWTTLPGNSPPPVGTIPSYMGTIVTSHVAKVGNGIAGNTVKIVVVKTNNPGYAPDPSHYGTGTIVATYC